MPEQDSLNLIHSILLLVLVGSAVIVHYRAKKFPAVRYFLYWAAFFLVIIIGYSYRTEFFDVRDRVLAELMPSRAMKHEDGSISFRASQDGHYYINAKIHGQSVRFLLDTGASDIVLSPADAKKVGFVLNKLEYTRTYYTANGKVFGAPVVLGDLQIGSIYKKRVMASVNGAEMNHSLLGMRFLSQVGSYEVRDGVLTIYP